VQNDFSNFKAFIANHSFNEVETLPADLQLWKGKSGKQLVYYAPFEHQNARPKIALVGITPGLTQATKALHVTQTALRKGDSDEKCLIAAKIQASFGGAMRNDLIKMLDALGINKLIGEESTRSLWTEAGYAKAQFCSLLQFPTFQNNKNFSATPKLSGSEAFRTMLETVTTTLNNLPTDAIVLPLGQTVTKALVQLRSKRLLTLDLIMVGNRPVCIPHPSGANRESVNLVLGWPNESVQDYAERCHVDYLHSRRWLKNGRVAPQAPQAYKGVRASRWQAVRHLRDHFGLN
jgi:hypothetical protein